MTKKIIYFILYHLLYLIFISLFWMITVNISIYLFSYQQTDFSLVKLISGSMLFPMFFMYPVFVVFFINTFMLSVFCIKKIYLPITISCLITSINSSFYLTYHSGNFFSNITLGYLLFGIPAIILTVIYYKIHLHK